METTDKHSLKSLWLLAGLVLLYLTTRLTGLTLLPIVSDEAVNIHWAQIVAQYPNEFLISRIADQNPLFMWLNAITLNIFSDPLVAGRWVSVLAGLASLTGLYFIGRDAFNRTVGFLAALIYIVVPYAYFFDRLALLDGLLSAFVIWMFRWSLHIAQETRPLEKAFRMLGFVLGAAFLTHAITWLVLPAILMVFYFWRVHQRPEFWKQFGISAGIALALNLPVLLGSHISFTLPSKGWFFSSKGFVFPWIFWFQNLMAIRDSFIIYLTLPLILVLGASLVYLFQKRKNVEKILWFWFLIPILVFLLFANNFASHNGVFLVPPLILLVAVACDRLAHFVLLTLRKLIGSPHRAGPMARTAALGGFMILVLSSGVAFDLTLIKNPVKASYRELDRLRYVEGLDSGYGIREAARFLAKEAEAFRKKTGVPLAVLLPMRPGNPAEGITVYLWNHPDVRLVPAFWWPKSPKLIPTGLRFSHRPSIYQTSPVMRRETTLLDYAHFILPTTILYPVEEFLKANPRFQQAWIFHKPGAGGPIIIFRNHPKK